MAEALGWLLARYLDAAQTAAQPEYHHIGNTPGITSTNNGSRVQEGQDVQDPDAVAATELLARQARILIKLHEAVERDAGPATKHGVDEELLKKRIADLASLSTSKFYSYRYDRLPAIWRQIYADSLILETYHLLLRPLQAVTSLPESVLDVVVEKLDRALITAGGGGRRPWLEKTMEMLEKIWISTSIYHEKEREDEERPSKRQRTHSRFDREFSAEEPFGRPSLSSKWACPRYSGWTMDQFEVYMNSNEGAPWPIVFTDLMSEWPALTDCPWKSPDYLLSKTLGGRRLVPVEIGRSYVDEGWGQELIQFRELLTRYVGIPIPETPPSTTQEDAVSPPPASSSSPTGYLAQHNLFQQIPSLRNDIHTPDFCWTNVPGHPLSPSHNQPPVDVPQLNAWFGPARTITPLHTDGYHNLLCQAVGAKYLRLYPPSATKHMRRRSPEHGVDMSNTSALDVGVLEGWDERPEGTSEEDVERMRAALEGVEYRECILEPGDTLVIPIGWWHYVRSLSVSFSVSFWWNQGDAQLSSE
ncbi:hypothetical protein B0T10DRAFT_477671 [Thelonectria olida]|uniref:JmjC domain-containing protein n=1 Tax=Thelonectria olida TaxID=1576542 RepID=A0A9P9ATL3_9HYPO|nr:hypothetical protein B0T10DRAFT_477671 [Thelonectria olida]